MIKNITDKIEFPKGEYYIGDLCYVIKLNEWDKFVNKMENSQRQRNGAGKCVWKKEKFWWHNTAVDNGVFYMDNGHAVQPCSVVTGAIGIIPARALFGVKDRFDVHIEEFNKPFEVWYDNGIFHFGEWKINTKGLI